MDLALYYAVLDDIYVGKMLKCRETSTWSLGSVFRIRIWNENYIEKKIEYIGL